MPNESPLTDKVFRRLKDLTLLCGVLWAVFSGSMDFYGVPEKVKNHGQEIVVLDKRIATAELRVQAVEQSTVFISKSLDELKSYQMEILKQVRK